MDMWTCASRRVSGVSIREAEGWYVQDDGSISKVRSDSAEPVFILHLGDAAHLYLSHSDLRDMVSKLDTCLMAADLSLFPEYFKVTAEVCG